MLEGHPLTYLNCEQWQRRLVNMLNRVRAGEGPQVQYRGGLLDGERVVVLGLADDGYEPVCVVLDDVLASRLESGEPRTRGRRWVATVTDLFLVRQMRRVTDLFSVIDDGWPAECRRARLDGQEVTVFGLVWPAAADPVSAHARGAGGNNAAPFRPALLCIDPGVAARLTCPSR